MRIVFADGGCERELRLRVGRPDACLADLAGVLGVAAGALSVDGRVAPPDTGLYGSGLVHGSLVGPADRLTVPRARGTVAVLRVVGGLEAGRAYPLRPGRTVVGRGAEANVRVTADGVSRRHAVVEVGADGRVTVDDLASANGTDVNAERIAGPVAVGPDDLVSLGGEVLLQVVPAARLSAVQHVDPVREAGPGGTLPFNRAPRDGGSPPVPALSPPARPPRADKAPFSVSSMLGPLALAAVIVVLTHDVRYAAIAALTPMMFAANFVEDRLRGRFTFRRGMREHAARLAAFERVVAGCHAAEVRARRAAHPDPAEVVHRATAPGVALWERRPGMLSSHWRL